MPDTREKAQLMSASEIDRTLVRLAHEVLEKTEELAKLGIHVEEAGIEFLDRAVQAVMDAVPVPLCIDSAEPAALEAALKVYRGKPLIGRRSTNSGVQASFRSNSSIISPFFAAS
jgi:cobalamin-dependent methionine synthase I